MLLLLSVFDSHLHFLSQQKPFSACNTQVNHRRVDNTTCIWARVVVCRIVLVEQKCISFCGSYEIRAYSFMVECAKTSPSMYYTTSCGLPLYRLHVCACEHVGEPEKREGVMGKCIFFSVCMRARTWGTGNVHAKKNYKIWSKGFKMILCTLGNLVLGLPIHFCSALTMAYFISILIWSKSKIGYRSIATIPEDRRGWVHPCDSGTVVCECVRVCPLRADLKACRFIVP